MRQRGIPRHVEVFIGEHLTSVAQLEILLLLRGQGERAFSAHDVAEALRIDPGWAAGELERLRTRGLFAKSESETGYCYTPATQELATAVDDLAKTFATHRVAVITMIFAAPSDSVGSFADAFKLRRDKDG